MVSARVKGNNLILEVMRLCKPPLFLIMFLTIQEAADPHPISRISGCSDAQVFQNLSNAVTNFDFCVSSQVERNSIESRLFTSIEHLSHTVGGTVTTDEIVERNPFHAHTVFGILGFKVLALSGHGHNVTRINSEEVLA